MEFRDILALLFRAFISGADGRFAFFSIKPELRFSVGDELIDQAFKKFARSAMKRSTCSLTHGRRL